MTDAELIEVVGREVMGWILTKSPPGTMWRKHRDGPGLHYGEPRGAGGNAWDPINNMNHAFMLVEKMISLDLEPQLRFSIDRSKWVVILWSGDSHDDEISPVDGKDRSFGRAICLAALEAIRNIK